ncbi:uncharacterized protein LOC136085303 [Hydra vulgaris]|uniref:Uncharacterized protein LOC136085303 n=1 Tax=Hydra vulgaris TaxID=6087 RepID=A0ABM4CLK5_HYDVU
MDLTLKNIEKLITTKLEKQKTFILSETKRLDKLKYEAKESNSKDAIIEREIYEIKESLNFQEENINKKLEKITTNLGKLKETKATLAKLPKLTTFLKPIEKRAETEVESQNSAEVVCINQSVEHDDIKENIATGNKNVNEEDVNRSPRNHRNEDKEDSNSDTNDAIEQINFEKSSELFSTDIANFHGKILTKDIKKIIVLSESCRPKGPFIRDPLQENRRFSKEYFKTTTKYGSIERMWLCYSPKLDVVYCEPCWLFSEKRKAKDNWREHGVRDWHGLSKKIKIHENSQQHIFACCIYEKWQHNETIDKNIEEQIRYQSNFWVQVLERMVNITLALCKNYLAFRSHVESFDNEYNGNFLTQVQLLA